MSVGVVSSIGRYLEAHGVSPPFSIIFVSAPVKTTKPMTHLVFRSVHPLSSNSLMVIGSILSSLKPDLLSAGIE